MPVLWGCKPNKLPAQQRWLAPEPTAGGFNSETLPHPVTHQHPRNLRDSSIHTWRGWGRRWGHEERQRGRMWKKLRKDLKGRLHKYHSGYTDPHDRLGSHFLTWCYWNTQAYWKLLLEASFLWWRWGRGGGEEEKRYRRNASLIINTCGGCSTKAVNQQLTGMCVRVCVTTQTHAHIRTHKVLHEDTLTCKC